MCFKQKRNMSKRMKMREETKGFKKAGRPGGRGWPGRLEQIWKLPAVA